MTSSQDNSQEVVDELAQLLASAKDLRKRLQPAGPLATSRIWKAEMQIQKTIELLAQDPYARIVSKAYSQADAERNFKKFRRAVRPNKRHLRRDRRTSLGRSASHS